MLDLAVSLLRNHPLSHQINHRASRQVSQQGVRWVSLRASHPPSRVCHLLVGQLVYPVVLRAYSPLNNPVRFPLWHLRHNLQLHLHANLAVFRLQNLPVYRPRCLHQYLRTFLVHVHLASLRLNLRVHLLRNLPQRQLACQQLIPQGRRQLYLPFSHKAFQQYNRRCNHL